MNNLTSTVTELLEMEFPKSKITFSDPRNDGKHFDLKIVSAKFEGQSRIQRSQMVYKIINNLIGNGKIHAITMKLTTPNE